MGPLHSPLLNARDWLRCWVLGEKCRTPRSALKPQHPTPRPIPCVRKVEVRGPILANSTPSRPVFPFARWARASASWRTCGASSSTRCRPLSRRRSLGSSATACPTSSGGSELRSCASPPPSSSPTWSTMQRRPPTPRP
ncbi:hypothetical protein GWK47_015016 [Chionoecetes opilio]|uniref:Uncharacterized protein n=1 Tax=Chionoecetes opilio TaxID=41210 RepID=A0A8J5CKA2_CHIOP|nr:hypothetical protein GWK47_015016 [Chionoecetes opilio]